MTREDAIEILRKNRPTSDPRPCGLELCDAVDMAISALRQQDVTDKDVGKMTNADRIRAMTDDELVNWIADINPLYCQTCVYAKPCRLEYDVETVNYAEKYDCKDGILQWLQQPAEEGTT